MSFLNDLEHTNTHTVHATTLDFGIFIVKSNVTEYEKKKKKQHRNRYTTVPNEWVCTIVFGFAFSHDFCAADFVLNLSPRERSPNRPTDRPTIPNQMC